MLFLGKIYYFGAKIVKSLSFGVRKQFFFCIFAMKSLMIIIIPLTFYTVGL
jgi:hypothetical protein